MIDWNMKLKFAKSQKSDYLNKKEINLDSIKKTIECPWSSDFSSQPDCPVTLQIQTQPTFTQAKLSLNKTSYLQSEDDKPFLDIKNKLTLPELIKKYQMKLTKTDILKKMK